MSERRVLIAGVSTRAAAESAARAGFKVVAIDAFADTDQHPAVRALALQTTFTARAAAEAVRNAECDAVTYLSPFEHHPEAVRALSAERTLWGNSPDVLRRVRDPVAVAETLRLRGFPTPEVRLTADTTRRWLLKPVASGGGHRIGIWHGEAVTRGYYLQEFVDGVPGSVVFAAARRRAVPLGIFRQLIGDSAFGASEFRYCGNILVAAQEPHDDAVFEAACSLVHAVADAFGLVGVNGIDFVARDGLPYAIEVNPRWCASMELVERVCGLSIFGTHAAACSRGSLPDFDLVRARRATSGASGKAVIFAREDVLVGDTRAWIRGDTIDAAAIRDIPCQGTRIRAGRPICTVFAEGPDAAGCYAALVERATRVYADLATWPEVARQRSRRSAPEVARQRSRVDQA